MLRRLLLPLVVAVALVSAAVASASTVKSSGLVGEVGPGYTIEVQKSGKDLKTIKAGTYTIKIEDKAPIHNFHLIGKGLNKKTGISFVGDQVWRVTFKPGKVTYRCDPHAALGMKGSFTVTG